MTSFSFSELEVDANLTRNDERLDDARFRDACATIMTIPRNTNPRLTISSKQKSKVSTGESMQYSQSIHSPIHQSRLDTEKVDVVN
jgi:hypothetical protein